MCIQNVWTVVAQTHPGQTLCVSGGGGGGEGGYLLRHVRSNEAYPSVLVNLLGNVGHVWGSIKSCLNVFINVEHRPTVFRPHRDA